MSEELGRRVWAIAEGSIPSESAVQDPVLVSHEPACTLNPDDTLAEIENRHYYCNCSRQPLHALCSTDACA
ncbi:MAG: sensory rhodopsin transducer [Dehalococcoidia bacterium]